MNKEENIHELAEIIEAETSVNTLDYFPNTVIGIEEAATAILEAGYRKLEVKPLVWVEYYGDTMAKAKTIFCDFIIITRYGSYRWIISDGTPNQRVFSTPEEAKAAAFAHYQALILSTLE